MEAGVRMLPWTAMPMLVSPIAGLFVNRIGGRIIIVTGLVLQAAGLTWFALLVAAHVSYASQLPGLILSGIGMALFFTPVAAVLMGSVQPEEQGMASGANNALREVGGALGIAVLTSVFTAHGGYASPQAFANGLIPALWVGASAIALAAVAGLLIPRHRRAVAAAQEASEQTLAPVA